MELVRVLLETLLFPAAVATLVLTVHVVPAGQKETLKITPANFDPQILTRKEEEQVHAAFEEDAVVKRQKREGHQPEARFTWEPLGRRVNTDEAGGL